MKAWAKVALFSLIILAAGCTSGSSESDGEGIPTIVATTGMLGDVLNNIVGDEAAVSYLMGPGVDPHLYQATPGDLNKLTKADVIVYNGLFLEGKFDDIMDKLSRTKKVVNFSDAITREDLLNALDPQYEQEIYDPHIWFDVDVWKQGVAGLGRKLAEYFPESAGVIAENTDKYVAKLDALKVELVAGMDAIPVEDRIMVTSHDAFRYFGRMLDVRVEALMGISTATEFGLQDRKALVDMIIEEDINAIFIETSVSDKPIMAILDDCRERGKDVELGGSLYSDALGAEDGPAGNYIDMLRHNVGTVVNGLKE